MATGYESELDTIKSILKDNPRGLTVTDIAKKIEVNRNSVAKYLDVLQTSGHVDVSAIGPAKVYFLSQRVPISGILNTAREMIVNVDSDLNLVCASDKFFVFVGTNRDSLGSAVSSLSFDLLSNEDYLAKLREGVEGKRSTMEWQTQDKHYAVKIIPLKYDNGSSGATTTIEDVTEEKKTQLALKESEERYRKIAETSADGIYLISADGTYEFVNQAYADILGYSREELIGKNYSLSIGKGKEEESVENFSKLLKGENISGEFIAKNKKGENFPVSYSAAPVYKSGEIASITGTVRDISYLKRLEEENKNLKAHKE